MKSYRLSNKAKRVYWISAIFLAILFAILWQRNSFKYESLKRHGIVINGATILKINRYGKRQNIYQVEYSYEVRGKNYREKIYQTLISNEERANTLFLGRRAPVIVDTIKPTRSMLLIDREDFQLFGMQRPDSLNWYDSIVNTDKGFFDFF